MARGKAFLLKLFRRNSGVAAVEFAIVLSVFVLVIGGVADLGHALYLKQIITNASREGARYGVVYIANSATKQRIPPDQLNPSIRNWVLDAPPNGQCDLSDILRGDDPQVEFPTADDNGNPVTNAYYGGTTGQNLIVKVTCTKTWWILDKFIPSLNSTITLTATTAMRLE